MLMKNINNTFASSTGRTLIYLSIFIAGSALHELLFRLIHPGVWSGSGLLLTLATLGAFMLIGVLFACKRHIQSRVTSAATLLILGFIALSIGHHSVPDPFLLVAALGIAIIGAQPVLHRQLTSLKQTFSYSILAVFISIGIVIIFTYGMTVLDRIAIQ